MQGFIPQAGALPNLLANGHCGAIQVDQLSTPTNGTTAYMSVDMWFLKNALGTNGVVTGSYNGVPVEYPYQRFSPYARISTAPTASQANGCELYIQNGWDNYVLPGYLNYPSTLFTLKTRVRGLGAVTHIGITPFYNAGAALGKPQTAPASAPEQTFAVATGALPSTDSAFTEVTATFDLSTALTAFQSTRYNMLGFRIRPITVSSGNLYDVGNGVQAGRTQLNPGASAGIFQFYGGSQLADLQQCQRFFWKTFPPLVCPAQNAGTTGAVYTRFNGASNESVFIPHVVPPMALPTRTTYNPSASNASARNTDAGSDVAFVDGGVSESGAWFAFNSGATGIYRWHYTLDCRP